MRSLDEIGLEHGTDKASFLNGTPVHDYLRVYEEMFGHLRERPCRILEIGVRSGASLMVWEEAFPLAHIVGVDCRPEKYEAKCQRAIRKNCNAADVRSLSRIAQKHGPFDLVIDDSAHNPVTAQAIIDAVFVNYIVPGGHLVVEDLNSGQPLLEAGESTAFSKWAFQFANHTNLQGRMHYSGRTSWPGPVTQFEDALESVTYRAGLMILKRSNRCTTPK